MFKWMQKVEQKALVSLGSLGSLSPLRPNVPVITTPPVPPTPTNINQPPVAICIPIKVNKVYDGDTATKVQLMLECSVRYLNCWAPELNEPGGILARDKAKEAEGKEGRLYIDMTDVQNIAELLTLGRVLGELWIDGETESESRKLVRLKLATTVKGGKLGE